MSAQEYQPSYCVSGCNKYNESSSNYKYSHAKRIPQIFDRIDKASFWPMSTFIRMVSHCRFWFVLHSKHFLQTNKNILMISDNLLQAKHEVKILKCKI
jgi:hypothetical protein